MTLLAPYSGLGMNYGHSSSEYQGVTDPASVQTNLNEMWALGFRKLRWNILVYTTAQSSINEYLAAIQMASAMGFYSIFGHQHLGVNIDAATQDGAYLTKLVATATALEAIRVLYPGTVEFCLGNEDDENVTGGLTKANHQLWIRSTGVDAVHAVFGGPVGHATHSAYMSDWIASGKGNLDRISMQFYNQTFMDGWVRQMYTAFGSGFYMSEWGTWNDGGLYGRDNYTNDEAWFTDMVARFKLHRKLGIDSYYFFWSGNLTGLTMKKSDGSYSPALKKILLNPLQPLLVESPLQRFGVTTKSAYFNGTNSKITIPIVLDRAGFNIAFWLYNDRSTFGSNGNTYPIIETIATDGNKRWGLRTDPNSSNLYMYTRDTTYYYGNVAGNTYALGKWRCYIIRFDNTNGLKVYNDVRTEMTLAIANSAARLGVLDTNITLFNASSAYRRGYLSNLIVDNGAEWSETVRNNIFLSHILPSGVNGFYPLTADANDASGNGNHGTATSITYKKNSPF